MHGSTIRSADATHSCLTLRVFHRPTGGTTPSAIRIGGATGHVITRAGPGVVPVVVVAAAAAEANQAVVEAVAVAAAVAAEVRTPAVGRAVVAVVAAAHTSRLQPHLHPAPNHESLTVRCRPRGDLSHIDNTRK